MKKIFLAALVAGFGLVANAQPPAGDANVGDFYGEKVTNPNDAVKLTDVAAKLNAGAPDMATAKIKAKVLDVCPKKGCWVSLELENGEKAFVKMKDYGFFVPVAAIGKTVVIDGEVKMKTTSVAELKHYAEDAKKPQQEIDAITQPKKEVRVLATGIVVVE